MDDKTVTIQLGAEELLYLLKQFNIPTLPGIGEDPVAGIDEDKRKYIIAAGFNSLRARGWVQEADTDNVDLAVDGTILALLGTCATAQDLMIINRLPADTAPESVYCHFGPHLIVMHSIPSPGLHQFSGTVDRDDAVSNIAASLRIENQPTPGSSPVIINNSTLDTVARAVREEEMEEAASVLSQQGVSPEEAQPLLSSIQTMIANSMVVKLLLNNGLQPSSSDGFSLLESVSGFWMLETNDNVEGEDELVISPVSANTCISRLSTMIPEVLTGPEST